MERLYLDVLTSNVRSAKASLTVDPMKAQQMMASMEGQKKVQKFLEGSRSSRKK